MFANALYYLTTENKMDIIKTHTTNSWQEYFSAQAQTDLTHSLENGQVLYFPKLTFHLAKDEEILLTPHFIKTKSKNISFNQNTNELRGLSKQVTEAQHLLLYGLLSRFASTAQKFVNAIFPFYAPALQIGRTSFRPVEVSGRASSYRKDDTRLHVDAFPANPNQGRRILRVFSNINPHNQPRVWRLGEPFEVVAQQFLPQLRKPILGSSTLLRLLNITKSHRTLYDHMMLQLHNNMKADEKYQRNAQQIEVHFPTNSTWVVQTDHVSHAAMSGQYLLEQTFYLPPQAMLSESKSPLRILERLLERSLVPSRFNKL
jgi:hypothetical protein